MFRTFEDFWPYYLQQHKRQKTRYLHFAGTAIAAVCLALSLLTLNYLWLLPALPVAYALSWLGHAGEGNSPATFSFPIWSLRGDIRMFRLWLSGKLEPELARAGVAPGEGSHI